MARSFNGSSDFLSVAAGLSMSSPDQVSMSVRFRPSSLTTTGVLMILRNVDDGNYLVFRGASGGDPLTATSNASGIAADESTTGTSGISAGVWYHAAGVWSSTTSRQVFLDGVGSSVNTTSVPAASYSVFEVGRFSSGGGSYFDGELAEAAVWNAALTAAEVKALASGISATRIRPQSLRFYAPLIRDVATVVKGWGTFTTNGTAVTDHPRAFCQ